MPPQTWAFLDFPKTSQKFQLLATYLPYRQLYLSSLPYTFSPNLLPKFSMSSFGCVPLILYGLQESLVWTPHLFGSSCPFANTLNWMTHPFVDLMCPSKPVRSSIIHLLDRCIPSLGTHPLPCALFLCRSSWFLVDVSMRSSNLFGAHMLPREDESTPWACSQVAPPLPKHNPIIRQSF